MPNNENVKPYPDKAVRKQGRHHHHHVPHTALNCQPAVSSAVTPERPLHLSGLALVSSQPPANGPQADPILQPDLLQPFSDCIKLHLAESTHDLGNCWFFVLVKEAMFLLTSVLLIALINPRLPTLPDIYNKIFILLLP